MKILLLMTVFVFSLTTEASILVEPQLGYVFNHSADSQLSVTRTRDGASAKAKISASGTAAEIGGRVGLQFFGFMTGGSLVKGSSDKGVLTGVFVGYNAPILLRAWATYNFKSEINYGSSKTEGTSIELGVGFTALPLLSINLMFRKYDIDKLNISGTAYTTSGFTPTELVLAVSAPFTFL